MPLRPSNSSSSTEEDEEERNCDDDNKPDWLRSVQLWKEPDQPRGDVLRKPIAVSVKRVGAGGAFHPFERENNVKGPVVVAAPASSTTETNGGEEKEKEGQSSQRKARRCWSSELHRRFLNALNQLGGSHAATPKQIRDLMKVDALTNDEIKSHLQKYRLHTRRPNSSSNSAQTPQIVLVGGLWMPPPEYSAAAAAAQPMSEAAGVPLNGVYAPVAALPSELGSEHLQKNKEQSKKSPPDHL
ncbi:myb family transcription factor EFM-like [Iris pallida]|uniref:Myb family transcription factor EFM-like n=1 Tax=Iris pallida TaxID=29817 RepID=A0AAX6DVT2_IRIPA|nr:myb family transcription factor EFM-like [Iris pallida]